jgi:hypothetical protein
MDTTIPNESLNLTNPATITNTPRLNTNPNTAFCRRETTPSFNLHTQGIISTINHASVAVCSAVDEMSSGEKAKHLSMGRAKK